MFIPWTPHFLPHPGLNCCFFFSIVAYALLQFWINHPNLASETFNGKWNIKHLVPCFTFFEKGDTPYWCFPVPSLYPMVTVHRHRMAIAIEVIVSYRHNLPRCTRALTGWLLGRNVRTVHRDGVLGPPLLWTRNNNDIWTGWRGENHPSQVRCSWKLEISHDSRAPQWLAGLCHSI